LSAGLRSDIDKLSRATQAATGRLQWSSIAAWAIGVALAIPLSILLGVWALLPSVEGVDPLRMRVAMSKLERCEVAGKPHLCIAIEDKAQSWPSPSGVPLTPVRGL